MRAFRAVLLSVFAAGMAIAPAPGIQAQAKAPTVRLLSPLEHVDVTRTPDEYDLFIPSAVYVAAVGGAFEIDATTAPDGTITLWQVRRDTGGAHRIRRIRPAGPVTMGEGLPRFFHIVLRDSTGAPVSESDVGFCPSGGFGLARVDTTGPGVPSYPYYCGTERSRAMVWGLDKGWAAALWASVPNPASPDGDYSLRVSIADTYAHQLGVSGGALTIGMTLTTLEDPGPCPDVPICFEPRSASKSAATSSVEQSPNVSREERTRGGDGLRGMGLPDLAALPAHSFATENNPEDGRDYLAFGATIYNGGSGPLVIEGFRRGSSPAMTAKQFIYRNGSPTRSATVGEFEYDTRPGHDHWHMEDVAQYDLLDANKNRVVLSEKQSFCLAPTDPIDLTKPGADWQPDRAGLWSACAGRDSIWLREVLPAGWGDTYFQSVAGQSFDITDLPNGSYVVRVTTDPFHKFLESRYDNNASTVAVELGGEPGSRTVVDA